MYKNVIRTSLAAAAILLTLAVFTNTSTAATFVEVHESYVTHGPCFTEFYGCFEPVYYSRAPRIHYYDCYVPRSVVVVPEVVVPERVYVPSYAPSRTFINVCF